MNKIKHGIWYAIGHDIDTVATLALQHRYTHIWVTYPVEKLGVPDNWNGYTYKELTRHGKTATVSVWKRGLGHVDIIFLKNTAWNDIYKDASPKEILDTIQALQALLPVPVTGSPGSVGWALLKTFHPEWIEDIPVNLRDLHFTAAAGADLIWQANMRGIGELYIHKFDKSAAYPAAATQTDVGVGTPVFSTKEWNPKDVGVWKCEVERPESYNGLYGMPVPDVKMGDYWLSGPRIRMLQSIGFSVTPLEGYVFPERHDLLVKWAKFLWEKRQGTTGLLSKAIKIIANSTIGFTAFKGFTDEEEEKRRPDIRLQVVSRNAEIMWHNIVKVRDTSGFKPCMVYMDAVYYLSNEPTIEIQALQSREGKLGGFRYEGHVRLTTDVKNMLNERHAVAIRLQYLNKIGWTK